MSKMKPSEKTLITGLIISVAFISWSTVGTSIGAGFIALAYLIGLFRGDLIKPSNPLLFWGLVGGFFWMFVGLLWTSNIIVGLAILKVMLPMLIFPLGLLSVRWDYNRWGPVAIKVFIIASFLAAIVGLIWGYWSSFMGGETHPRIWSPFISHIRMGLILAIGWGILLLNRKYTYSLVYGIIAFLSIWNTASVTGIAMLSITAFFCWIHLVKSSVKNKTIIISSLIISFGLMAITYSIYPSPFTGELATHTPWGNKYEHHPEKYLEENGNKVWNLLAIDEMSKEWNLRSKIPFDSLDGNGHQIQTTLIRYLTSLDVPKNGESVKTLAKSGIQHVENGHTTVKNHTGLMLRLDVLKYELGNFLDGGDPGGNSVTQRFEFMNTGIYILKSNGLKALLFGVGTGDLPASFERAFVETSSRVDEVFRQEAHNQYISWWVRSGFVGLVLWLIVLCASWPKTSSIARLAWWIIVLSCFAEDTLETQAGVTLTMLVLTGLAYFKSNDCTNPQI